MTGQTVLRDGREMAGEANQYASTGGGAFRRLLLAAVVSGVFIVLLDLPDGRFYYRDIDDVLRLVQIRQLLDHGRWFDLTLSGIDMPGAYVSPWSRLVDLPYLALTLTFEPLLGRSSALWWSTHVWQSVLLLAFCCLWLATALRFCAGRCRVEVVHVVAAFAMMPLALWEFAPGRVDHHNMQIVILMLFLFGVSCWSLKGGMVVGLAAVLSFSIGLELAPVLVVLLLCISMAWVLNLPGSRAMLVGQAVSVLIAVPACGLLLTGPQRMLSTECDAFSAPYMVGLLGFAAATLAAGTVIVTARPLVRFLVLAGCGMLLLLGLAVLFPSCLAGPYGFIDPVVRTLWLERIQQEMSFLDFYEKGEYIKVVWLGLAAVVLLAAMPLALRRIWRADAAFIIICVAASLVLLLTLLQTRYIRFPFAIVMLLVPLVWSEVRLKAPAMRKALFSAVAGTVLFGVALIGVVPHKPFRPDIVDYTALDLCTDIDTSPLQHLAPGRIIAPTSLGLFMLGGLPQGFTINAISFHRAASGMRRVYDLLLSKDVATRRDAASPFDYLAVCHFPMVDEIASDTLFAVLARGGSWPGLELVADGPLGGLRLFRIDHSAFQ
ncbi:hypothetical protein [Rhizobium sp. FY34]|uniref:hypothetical protein n=1 Tax=Rhizobium sp. FY34 TaxID=2562309 RepID=UPI0010C00CCD|nr:hypothetical protein [Rhizobium sp. FY34]